MPTATLTSKGQITIPREIREDLRLKAGDRISLVKNPDGQYVLQTKKVPFEQVMGMLRRAGRPPVSVEEMDAGIGRYLSEKHQRAVRRRGK
ncbi:MAG: AbrB/MazE/SpoVT family DNA-binding domain-containing protein [Acidobacteria bacterium]|nr:AbrB/MazE/SpoVT family DNA-binding domain-containing protein [Acidobacteriota bacterium]